MTSRGNRGFMIARPGTKFFAAAVFFGAIVSSVSAAEVRQLRLGHFPNITHAQAVYAHAGGQFEQKVGISIKWSLFNAGPTAIEAMFADAVDATFVGPSPAINGFIKSRGEKF